MKFRAGTFGICLCMVLAMFINQASSDNLQVALKVLPILGVKSAEQKKIAAGLSVVQIVTKTLKHGKKDSNNKEISEKLDLNGMRTAILDEFNTMDTNLFVESARIIRDLTMAIESNGLFKDLSQTVDYLQRTYSDMMDVVIDPKIKGTQKRLIMNDMLSYSSTYRTKLRSFISTFIKASSNELLMIKPVKLFYERILEKQDHLAAEENDCSTDSMHSKIYKSFLFFLKVLTDGYSMAVAAHFVQYQEELTVNPVSAELLSKNGLTLIDEYHKDVQTLTETIKWALNAASQEIRNCGTFDLEEGKTFERVSISHMLPKILYFEYIDVFYYKCRSETDFANFTLYDFGECDNYLDDIPFGSQITIPLDVYARPAGKGPFNFMKVQKPDKTEEVFGHIPSKGGPVIEYNFKNHPECYTTFCKTYRKNLFAISTQLVEASPGYVITGMRFRIRNRVIYIDIQQGKFLNVLSVDPETVHWKETPESGDIEYLGSDLNKFELGDFKLKKNSLLTRIRLTKGSLHKGLIRVFIDGLTPPHMNNTDSVSYESVDLQLNELELLNADNPIQMSNISTKNLISKPPVPDERYFVTFQQSDFKKDFGQTTIPLLDIREVSSNPPAPLNGFGFYHEAVSGSGGLIAIKLITPNMTDHVHLLSEN